MRVNFTDGGYLDCSEVEFCGGAIIFDGVRYANIDEVENIEDDEIMEEV